MKLHLLILLVLVSASTRLLAEPDGPGNFTCGQWTDARKVTEQKGPGWAASYVVSAWVKGFLDGVSLTLAINPSKKGIADFVAPENATQNAWLDTYCRDHPLDNFYAASVTLVSELLARNGVK